jgi:anti-sigma regulatory factor (Ser/Thr protein kinase)
MCEHTAVLYRGANDLSRCLGSSLRRAAAEQAAVLICLDRAAEARIRTDFGSICDRFTFDPADSWDAIPGRAMAALDRFVTAAEASGAASAWSIGAIPLRADGRDVRWIHYEEAVNEIFVHRPLRAVCAYDATRTPAYLRHDVGRTHESLIGDWTHREDDSPVDSVVPFPTRGSDLIIRDPTPAVARAALERLLGSCVSPVLIMDLQIVASELVTNAVVHGASPAVFEVWHEADGCALRVTDRGPGGVGRYAHLRPLQAGPHGGFGLFTVGQLADSVEFSRQDDTTVVSVYMALR